MTLPRPYFMENDEWFYYDEEEGICKLTDKAPQKAIESYKEFYDDDDDYYDDGEWEYEY